jgi:DNA-binding CsgD family transcriptional regulator/tetratricopeptide (TPR) repeat protein/energy-coupling factor transporter ATP-binding protein EcfA2
VSVRFVGRELPLRVAREQLVNAGDGRPEPVLITGESGAGKSMFLSHLAGIAAASGFQVFRLDGESRTGTGAYRALAAAVARWASERPDAATATLARQVGSGAAPSLRPEDRRLLVVDALRQFFELAAATAPVLLAIDDLHLIDDDTADAGLFLMRHLRRHRVLVTATWRTDVAVDNAVSDDLQRALAAGQLVPIALGPFDDDELSALVESRTGTTPTADLVATLHARTGGMPFFAAELADAIAAHPATQRQCEGGLELPLPQRAATTVLHRVFALGADACQVASVVALLGWVGVDRLPMIATVTTMTEQRTGDAFDRLVRARLLIPDGTTFRFTHAIVRDALVADIHPARQRRLHRQIARVLADERRAGERRDIAEIADHLRLGIAGHDPAAAALLTEAGDDVAFDAPDEAAAWYREALVRLRPDHPDAAVTQVRLSRAMSLAGRHAEAGKLASAALARLPAGEARSDALAVAAHAALFTGDRRRASELLDAAASAGDAPPSLITVVRALVDGFDASPAGAVRAARTAVACGAPEDDPTLLGMLATAQTEAGDFEAAAATVHRLRTAFPSRAPDERLRAAFHACVVSAVDLDPRDALRDVADIRPSSPLVGWFHSAAAWAHLRLGHLDDTIAAGELARAAVDPAVGDVMLEATITALVLAHLERADVAQGEEIMVWAAAVPVFTPGTGLRIVTARLHAARDEFDRALEVVQEAIELEAARRRCNVLGLLYSEQVALAVSAGDDVVARAANVRLQALPRSASAVAMNIRCLMSDAMCARSSDLAARAHQYAAGHGLELDAARALALDGEIRHDADRLTSAHTELARLGAVSRQREVAAQPRAIGRRTWRDSDHGPTLSATEIAVTSLVADGLTNRQVGARINLSPKTIEVYLSRIYAKTGCRSRVELAVAVRDGTIQIPA